MEGNRKAELIAAVLDKVGRMSAEELRSVLAEIREITDDKSNR